ncbi:hypothetical protein [Nostoc sp. UHCC 0302]|uniref:hypothetical protein n=1 Tax=Nostoc sp. UHCC 0302 TaxID=3134896 RepID=UPI00311CDFC4
MAVAIQQLQPYTFFGFLPKFYFQIRRQEAVLFEAEVKKLSFPQAGLSPSILLSALELLK